jgi:hypothetical protein
MSQAWLSTDGLLSTHHLPQPRSPSPATKSSAAALLTSALAVLLVLGGQVALLPLSRLRFSLDTVSFALLLPNAAGALALAALAPASVPIALAPGGASGGAGRQGHGTAVRSPMA